MRWALFDRRNFHWRGVGAAVAVNLLKKRGLSKRTGCIPFLTIRMLEQFMMKTLKPLIIHVLQVILNFKLLLCTLHDLILLGVQKNIPHAYAVGKHSLP